MANHINTANYKPMWKVKFKKVLLIIIFILVVIALMIFDIFLSLIIDDYSVSFALSIMVRTILLSLLSVLVIVSSNR